MKSQYILRHLKVLSQLETVVEVHIALQLHNNKSFHLFLFLSKTISVWPKSDQKFRNPSLNFF